MCTSRACEIEEGKSQPRKACAVTKKHPLFPVRRPHKRVKREVPSEPAHPGPVVLDLRDLPRTPAPDFLRQLLGGNVALVHTPAQPKVPPNISAYLTWREAFGMPLPPQKLVDAFKTWSWRAVLLRVSVFGAVLASRHADAEPDPELLIRAPLKTYLESVDPQWARIAEYIARHPGRRLLHEQVIYLIAAMAVLYGKEVGPEPLPEHFAGIVLAANDYLSDWAEADSRKLTDEEALAADLAHVARFNTYPDPVRDLVRVNLLYSRAPLQGPLAVAPVWSRIQMAALGCAFEEFFLTCVMPLQFEAQRWGAKNGDEYAVPIIEPETWYSETAIGAEVGKSLVDTLAITREAAQAELQARTAEGIPHAPTLFIRKPFVKLDDRRVVAVSPWAVREQLKGGLYMMFSRMVNAEFDKEVWPSTFGNLFELYCREVALLARRSEEFCGDLVLSEAPGSPDEIEDIVIVERTACVLGSVKSKLVREDVARQARSRTALLDWYDEFFFARKKGRYQEGALRLLDRKIEGVRSGKHTRIAADAPIAPLLITFDDLADNLMLTRWIAKRCREEGLLAQAKVLPVVLAPVDEFEVLMGLAANGESIFELLSRFTGYREQYSNLNNYFHKVRNGETMRLAELEDRFHAIAEEAKRRLFSKT